MISLLSMLQLANESSLLSILLFYYALNLLIILINVYLSFFRLVLSFNFEEFNALFLQIPHFIQ